MVSDGYMQIKVRDLSEELTNIENRMASLISKLENKELEIQKKIEEFDKKFTPFLEEKDMISTIYDDMDIQIKGEIDRHDEHIKSIFLNLISSHMRAYWKINMLPWLEKLKESQANQIKFYTESINKELGTNIVLLKVEEEVMPTDIDVQKSEQKYMRRKGLI